MCDWSSRTVHGHLVDLGRVVLLDVSQDPDVIVLHKVDGHALSTITTRPTNPGGGQRLLQVTTRLRDEFISTENITFQTIQFLKKRKSRILGFKIKKETRVELYEFSPDRHTSFKSAGKVEKHGRHHTEHLNVL